MERKRKAEIKVEDEEVDDEKRIGIGGENFDLEGLELECEVDLERINKKEKIFVWDAFDTQEEQGVSSAGVLMEFYECDHCSSRFPTTKTLMEHMRTHGLHECEICQATFTGGHQLKLHYTTHTGEKPYQCNQCHMTFSRPFSLTRHMRIHTGEKPYGCDLCGIRYTKADTLKRHKIACSKKTNDPLH